MEQIISTISTFSPMATIALALTIIYILVRGKYNNADVKKSITELQLNHIHEIADTLKRIEEKLDKMNDYLIWIKSRINNK